MPPVWNIAEAAAFFQTPAGSGRWSPDAPHLGLQVEQSSDEADLGARLLALADAQAVKDPTGKNAPWPEWRAPLIECYVRGADCIASYAQTPAQDFRTEVRWHAAAARLSGKAVLSITTTLSVQTNLLDSHPALVVESALPAGGCDFLAGVDWQPAGEQLPSETTLVADREGRWCQLVWPEDVEEGTLIALPENNTLRWTVFGHFMEKGVIRRGRVRTIFSAESLPQSAWEEAIEAFRREPLPLAT